MQDNISTLIAFNLSSLKTAQELSARCGMTTIRVKTPNSNHGTGSGGTHSKPERSWNHSSSSGINVNQQGRNLLFADELLRWKDVALIFHLHHPPIVARTLKHYAEPAFKNGRMGRQPERGPWAGVMAVLVLAVSILCSVGVALLPTPRFTQPGRLSGPAAGRRYVQQQRYVPLPGQAYGATPLPASGTGISSRSAFQPAGANRFRAAGGHPFDSSSTTKEASNGR